MRFLTDQLEDIIKVSNLSCKYTTPGIVDKNICLPFIVFHSSVGPNIHYQNFIFQLSVQRSANLCRLVIENHPFGIKET